MHVHHGHFVDAQDLVVVEVLLLNAPAVDRDRASERRRQTVHDGTLDLRIDAPRVHDAPAIQRTDDAMYFKRARIAVH